MTKLWGLDKMYFFSYSYSEENYEPVREVASNTYFVGLLSGEENGNPLQYSCLENPVDRGPWWAAVHGVAQNQTRLKQLSSSSRAA